MGDYVNIKVPEYYYWEGQTPTLPDKDTSVKYKLVGPDSSVIDINPGFYIEKIDNYYSIRGNGKTRKLTLSFTKDTKITKEGTTTTAITNNDTTYTFNGKPTGKENQYYVSTGIITIKESTNQALMNEVKSGAKYMASSGEAYVQNTAAKSEFLQTDTIFSSSRTLRNLSKLVFFFFKDFVTLVLISVFIVTVIIILRAKSELIYPHDLQSYPYVTPKYNQDVSVITPEPNFCDKTLTNVKMPDKVKNDEDIQVLEIFNKKMIDPDPQILEWRAEAFQNTCKHASNSTTGAFTILKYWMLYLVLNNYIYIQKTFSFLHNSLSFIPNDSFIMMIVFTILLFVLFYLVPNINIGIVQPYFHYNSGQEVKLNKDAFVDFTGEQGISGVIMSGLFSIISLFIVVFIPTYIILATTGVIGNISSLINILMTSSSVECMFLSFFSIISSINYILKLLPEDLDITKIRIETNIIGLTRTIIDFILNMFRLIRMPELKIQNIILVFINILTFLGSIFGIFLPFFMAFYYSIGTAGTVIKSAFYLPKKNFEIIKQLIPILVIFLLIILLKDVYLILGKYLFIITFFIIAITGFFMSK